MHAFIIRVISGKMGHSQTHTFLFLNVTYEICLFNAV